MTDFFAAYGTPFKDAGIVDPTCKSTTFFPYASSNSDFKLSVPAVVSQWIFSWLNVAYGPAGVKSNCMFVFVPGLKAYISVCSISVGKGLL